MKKCWRSEPFGCYTVIEKKKKWSFALESQWKSRAIRPCRKLGFLGKQVMKKGNKTDWKWWQ